MGLDVGALMAVDVERALWEKERSEVDVEIDNRPRGRRLGGCVPTVTLRTGAE